MVRGLMEVCGPITGEAIADQLGIAVNEADAALEALEGEGVVLARPIHPRDPVETDDVTEGGAPECGDRNYQFRDPKSEIRNPEWCHRRLLARIHRLTMEGLRKQIEPVTVDVFVRFLARHHGLIPGSKRAGTSGLFETIGMLQGLDLPAVAWERDLFAARLENYRPEWLDELCLTGEVGWGRLFPTQTFARSGPPDGQPHARRAAVALPAQRSGVAASGKRSGRRDDAQLAGPRRAHAACKSHGAMFAADLMAALRLLPDQFNDVLGELVSQGLVTADGFAGLRACLRSHTAGRRPRCPRSRPPPRAAGGGRAVGPLAWPTAEDGE